MCERCVKHDENIHKKIKERKEMKESFIGKKVIIRGDRSGVFFGTLVAKEGNEVLLNDCRRIWYWEGAASISQLAAEGVKRPDDCKFTVAIDDIIITDAIEIIKCTPDAIASIEAVKEWKI